MVSYDPRSWLSVVFTFHGSVLPKLAPRIALASALGGAAAWLFAERGFRIPSTAHSMVGVALGLLLVFRTNASFDRWWEGRKLLGSAVNRTRDLTRQVTTLLEGEGPEVDALRADLRRRVVAFYGLLRLHLRAERDLKALGALLTDDEREALEPLKNRPAVMITWLSGALAEQARQGRLTEQRLQVMDANLSTFNDVLGACERILKTPIPFAYAQHIKTFLVMFCFSAPFAIVGDMKWYTPIAAGILAFAMFGIDEIGVEIEDPFGHDPNDLPLDAIGEGIELTTGEIVTRGRRFVR